MSHTEAGCSAVSPGDPAPGRADAGGAPGRAPSTRLLGLTRESPTCGNVYWAGSYLIISQRNKHLEHLSPSLLQPLHQPREEEYAAFKSPASREA